MRWLNLFSLFCNKYFLHKYLSFTWLYTIQKRQDYSPLNNSSMWPLDGESFVKTGIDFAKRFFFFCYRKHHRPIKYGHLWTLLWQCISWNRESLEWTNHMSAYWHLNRVSSLAQNSKRTKRRDGHLCSTLTTASLFTPKKVSLISHFFNEFFGVN